MTLPRVRRLEHPSPQDGAVGAAGDGAGPAPSSPVPAEGHTEHGLAPFVVVRQTPEERFAGIGVRSVAVAMGVSILVLALVAAYGALAGSRGDVAPVPFFATVGGAVAIVLFGATVLPWRRLAREERTSFAYLWLVLDLAFVSLAIAFSGGSRSELFLVEIVICMFVAGVAMPRRTRLIFFVLLISSYLLTLVGTGWDIGGGTLLIRLGILAAIAAVASTRTGDLARELSFHRRVQFDLERRAALWSKVAGLGGELDALDPDAILRWAVSSACQLGFDAAAVATTTTGRPDRLVIACEIGFPAALGPGTEVAGEGLLAVVERTGQPVAVAAGDKLRTAAPPLAADGVVEAVLAPIRVDKAPFALLVAGSRHGRSVSSEEIAAVELLAVHAAHGIEMARRLEDERRDTAQFRTLLESAPDAMIVIDGEGMIVRANRQAGVLFGREETALVGMRADRLVPGRLREIAGAYWRRWIQEGGAHPFGAGEELFGMRADGVEFPADLVLARIDTPQGPMVTASVRDISERRQFEHQLSHQATHDHLTGLPNRELFSTALTGALTHHPVRGDEVVVCFLDVDHFKYVNDGRGHRVGDSLLCEVADRLQRAVRPDDVVARFGGDEFAVMALGLDEPQAAIAYAWRLLAAFDEPFDLDDVQLYVTASVGVAAAAPGAGPDDVLRDADAAMYQAKQKGRGRVELFDEALTARASQRVELEAALHDAVERDQLFLVYQPIIDLDSQRLVGMEALVRWRRPAGGVVYPMTFIPIAEESSMILRIGRWVLTEACRQAAALRARFPELVGTTMSVNVSSRQLEHDQLLVDTATALHESGLPAECLVLEITESSFIRDMFGAIRRLEALKSLGVRIALDDFGTGFSSLNSLSRLPIDVVKIDKSFVDSLSTRTEAVIAAVVDVAGAFDLTVVAEGVEFEDQPHRLRQLGCRQAQGFFFSEPLLPELFEERLAPTG